MKKRIYLFINSENGRTINIPIENPENFQAIEMALSLMKINSLIRSYKITNDEGVEINRFQAFDLLL